MLKSGVEKDSSGHPALVEHTAEREDVRLTGGRRERVARPSASIAEVERPNKLWSDGLRHGRLARVSVQFTSATEPIREGLETGAIC